MFFTFLSIIIFTPWLQTVPGYGQVIAYAPLERQQNIEAPIKGMITKWYVKEGSYVKKGDNIAIIQDNDPMYLKRLQEQRTFILDTINAYQNKINTYLLIIKNQEEARNNAILSAEFKINTASEKVKASENTLIASEAALETAKLNLERQEILEKKGLTSTRNYELAILDYKRAFNDYERNKALLEVAKKEFSIAIADKEKLLRDTKVSIEKIRTDLMTSQSELAKAFSELNKIDITIARQNTQFVKAPINGTILRLKANQVTEYVKEGDTLAIIVPDTNELAVELLITGNDVPLVVESEKVRLQFEGWPALQFNAWPSVAIGTFGGIVKLVDSTDNGKGQFRVLVLRDKNEKWPDKKYLRQGVKAYGWIIVNQVPLWYELWRQFNGFQPSVKKKDIEEEKDLDSINAVKLKKQK
jgi:multidrug efflux pump subunit AcrA (membrane-fusion protein)